MRNSAGRRPAARSVAVTSPQGWQPNARYEHVWVVVRFDKYLSAETALEDQVTVTKVFMDDDAAAAEVDRLNALRADSPHVRYVAQIARLVL